MSKTNALAYEADAYTLLFKTLEPTPEKLADLARLCANSFSILNPIWKKMNIPIEEIHQVMKQRINFAGKNGTIYVNLELIVGHGGSINW